jgi:putative ABC transport system permease protein
MFKSNLKIAWRNIVRSKVYTLINITGLTLGICACIAIYIITSFEFSFDAFHPDKDRIYRVMGDVTESTGDKLRFARTPAAVLPEARNGLTGLETIAGVIPYNATITITDGLNNLKQFESKSPGINYPTTVLAEPQYFDIFKYHWLAGNANSSLAAPFTVVLTEKRARQYFGSVAFDKMIGKQVVYQDSLKVIVAGIVKSWNNNTDLAFTDFISYRTLPGSFLKNSINTGAWKQNAMSAWVFTKLKKGISPTQVNAQLTALAKARTDAAFILALQLEPISEMHFNSDVIENQVRTAHKPTLYVLMAIALFILVLAIINFVNLSTAQSIRRAKEVGVRKVLGSGKASLVFQFLSETFVITFIAVLMAVAAVNPVLSLFRQFIPEGVHFSLLEPFTIFFILLVTLVTSLLAGLYPAKVLSSYMPALSLKGAGSYRPGEKWLLRKGLIVFQFSVSLVFIIGSIVIANQLRYVKDKDPGFRSDAIITMETPREGPAKTALLAQRIKQISGVSKVAVQWIPPMSDNPRGMKLKLNATDTKDFWVTQVAGNEDFIPVYGMKIIEGRNIAKSDSVTEFVINESLVRYMGIPRPQEAIGKILYWNDKPYPVVGVVADFHTSSFHEPITPLCIINRPDRLGSLAVKLASTGEQSGMISDALVQMERAWKQVYPSSAFNYSFYDETLAMLYEKDRQAAMLINTSMAVTIFISCIGLFGLALFTSEKRAKEISIRKTLGASTVNIVAMLGKDFVVLVIIALFIASPIAWYFANHWLQGFAYRSHISLWIFILAGVAAIIVALTTVSGQAIKAAIVNPIKNLRTE